MICLFPPSAPTKTYSFYQYKNKFLTREAQTLIGMVISGNGRRGNDGNKEKSL